MRAFLTIVPLAILAASTAIAMPTGGSPGGSGAYITRPDYGPSKMFRKQHAILAVRDEGLKLQSADGGKLTDAHRKYLQAKLDAVLVGNY